MRPKQELASDLGPTALGSEEPIGESARTRRDRTAAGLKTKPSHSSHNRRPFPVESIQNLITFYENLEGSLSFEKRFVLFAIVSKLSENNVKYVITLHQVAKMLINSGIPGNAEKDVIFVLSPGSDAGSVR